MDQLRATALQGTEGAQFPFFSPDGTVKILDFGLAKVFAVEEDLAAEASQSPTLTRGSAIGAIMGTASYMSPEQSRGKPVDRRTDVWAFGCCLYESLTGHKAFDGETVADILSKILQLTPDWTPVPHPKRCGGCCSAHSKKTRREDSGISRTFDFSSKIPSTARRRVT